MENIKNRIKKKMSWKFLGILTVHLCTLHVKNRKKMTTKILTVCRVVKNDSNFFSMITLSVRRSFFF